MNGVQTGDVTSAANDYRLLLTVREGDDIIAAARDQLAAWLRARKDWAPSLGGNALVVDEGGKRDLLTIYRESSHAEEFRARLTETSPAGLWTTELTVQQPRQGGGWVSLTVANSESRWVAVPGLARYLLDALTLADGDTVLSRESRVVGPAAADDVLEQICDPGRKGLYFVAGTGEEAIDFRLFSAQVERWTREVKGLGQVAVLTPEATKLVREALGDSHAVRPWTLRTFYPEVDPAIASDGLRHRYLTVKRLAEEPDEAIRKLLGRIARRHAANVSAPPEVGQAYRALQRLEDRLLLDAISNPSATGPVPPHTDFDEGVLVSPSAEMAPARSEPAHAVGEEAATYLALVELVKGALGLEELTPAALQDIAERAQRSAAVAESVARISRQLEERQTQVESLQSTLREERDRYEAMQLDERIAAEHASKLEDEARWLRSRLAGLGDHQGAYEVVPMDAYTTYPTDFDDLRARMKELATGGVHFTGDSGPMLALDEYDTLGKLVRTTWDVLLALVDYVRARRDGACDCNLKGYLLQTPQGYRTVAPGKFSESETKTTMQQWGDERIFKVPVEVHDSGESVMAAHFRLGRLGMVSPRLYYLDCVGTTGEIYVGYVGQHLTNTMT